MDGSVERNLTHNPVEEVTQRKGKNGLSHTIYCQHDWPEMEDSVDQHKHWSQQSHSDVSSRHSVYFLLQHKLVGDVNIELSERFREISQIVEKLYKFLLLFLLAVSHIGVALQRSRKGENGASKSRGKVSGSEWVASQCLHPSWVRNLKCFSLNFDLILDIDVFEQAMESSVTISQLVTLITSHQSVNYAKFLKVTSLN